MLLLQKEFFEKIGERPLVYFLYADCVNIHGLFMSETKSTMLPLATVCPDFALLEPLSGETKSIASYPGYMGYLIVFMCNHCPYVVHILPKLNEVAAHYEKEGIMTIAINSNDVEAYPADAPAKMVDLIKENELCFPYLFDETQEVAKSFRAACTPDFFLLDDERELVYRGQFDSSRPKNGVGVTGNHIRLGLDAMIRGNSIPETQQVVSVGCNIKWKAGNAPDYFL